MKRLPTMVPGLDDILSGGLFEGGVYILEGPPGVGKTTLANQMAYGHVEHGRKTLYVTMLAESHARMLEHMEGQSFFRRASVNADVFYLSAYRELEDNGLKAVVDLLRGELVRSRASLVVVDGLIVGVSGGAPEDAARRFVHELQSLVTAMSCTCLLLTSGRGNVHSAEQTMVDGILAFEENAYHWRAERRMQVRKFRGSDTIRGSHTYCITDAGLKFFPRLESMPLPVVATKSAYVSSGLAELDGALGDRGIAVGTSSVVIGDSGTGKTTLALIFAAGSREDGASLFVSCTELPDELERIARRVGVPMGAAIDSGALTIRAWGQQDESLDEMGHKLLRWVDELKVQRLVVDGLAGLADTLAFSERGYRFVGRLLIELKARGVTSLFTLDRGGLAVAAGTGLAPGVTSWFDNEWELPRPVNDGDPRTLRILKLRTARSSAMQVGFVLPAS